jgi:NTP pyrophosphatase (non-canonical NTP hydrolase)
MEKIMTEAIIMSGPCQVCGCVNYAASFGGPTICPSCDCGFYGAPVVQRQGREIIALREEIAALRAQPAPLGEAVAFQSRVDPWLIECFGLEIARDVLERNHRFLEESLELVQANGCSAGEAHQLVDYVYGRDQGDINQEVGGVMVTLAALCLASGVDMHAAAETELERIWTKVEKIRAKHFAKPKFSPLPGYATVPPAPKAAADVRAVVIEECAGIADKFDCNLLGYPNEEAKSYYESGVIDASVNIAQAIRALALNPQIATVPVPAPTFTQMGCICPPTSEKTCESPMCPRKGFRFTAANIGQAST